MDNEQLSLIKSYLYQLNACKESDDSGFYKCNLCGTGQSNFSETTITNQTITFSCRCRSGCNTKTNVVFPKYEYYPRWVLKHMKDELIRLRSKLLPDVDKLTKRCLHCNRIVLGPKDFQHDHTEDCPECGRVREMEPTTPKRKTKCPKKG